MTAREFWIVLTSLMFCVTFENEYITISEYHITLICVNLQKLYPECVTYGMHVNTEIGSNLLMQHVQTRFFVDSDSRFLSKTHFTKFGKQ